MVADMVRIISELHWAPRVRHPLLYVGSGRSSSRIAAAPHWHPRTRWRPSRTAWRSASTGIELDVRASRDGRVVVHHDETLDRTTSLRGPVGAHTADELARAGVPELSQVLHACRDVRVIVEIKVNEPAFGRRVVEELRRARAVERACVGRVRPRGAARRPRSRNRRSPRAPRSKKCAWRSIARGCDGP